MESEAGLDRRSLTPCLDENDENCAENSKEIELSDISDIEEDGNWSECNKNNNEVRTKANGNESKESSFKKINRSTRGRNYRDNIRRKSETGTFPQHRQQIHQPYRRFDNKRRDIERYSVRNVVASREFSISRSRSRSPKVERSRVHRSKSFSPKPRDNYRKKSISPAYYTSKTNRYKSPPRKYSPKHSRSPSLDQYRQKRSPSPELPPRRSRSRHKVDKNRKHIINIFLVPSLTQFFLYFQVPPKSHRSAGNTNRKITHAGTKSRARNQSFTSHRRLQSHPNPHAASHHKL